MACDGLLRGLFVFFNTVLWALGWTSLGVGIKILVADWDWENLITNPDDNPEKTAAQIMITCGTDFVVFGICENVYSFISSVDLY